MADTSFLGTGWSFPPTFDRKEKTVKMVSDEDDIKESLHILLTTTIGERIMRPNYGCNLQDYLFESFNITLETFLHDLVESAILYFEPRIDLLGIKMNPEDIVEGRLEMNVEFTVRSTNARHNMVIPFYKIEGTNIG